MTVRYNQKVSWCCYHGLFIGINRRTLCGSTLAGALIYIDCSGDALLGAIRFVCDEFRYGCAIAPSETTAGKLMPKPGKWMQAISTFFGITLLGVAIWMLSRIMDGTVTMALWTILGISSAILCRGDRALRVDASG